MIRTTILAAAALLIAAPATAQSISQSDLDERYDRALAAGYKALMLCSGIAHAERNRQTRTAEDIHQWELTGIYPSLDPIIRDLPYRIVRGEPIEFVTPESGFVRHVEVDWVDDMPPRIAENRGVAGCAVLPIGASAEGLENITASFRRVPPVVSPVLFEQNAVLQQVGAQAFGDSYGADARTTAVLISREDRLQFRQFAEGFGSNTPQRTWSVAKSIASTLVGMAVHDGYIDVDSSAGAGLAESDARATITVDHMLRMASGRYSDTPGNRTDPMYWGGATVDERARVWPLVHPPGEFFRYANNDTLMAIEAIQPWLADQQMDRLMERVNMFDIAVEADWQGNHMLSSQVWASSEDLLTLGQLYLDDGLNRFGERILPEGWVEYVSSPSGPQPDGSRGWGYGAGWWLLNQSEGIPADTFMAAGNRGQYIVVVPSRDIVIVRRGEDPAGGSGFDIEAFTRDVLAALEN